ncbi:MAG TPA: twin transmembrane helix small protein [Gammaproteobacteria bacterium]|nr:twin transmembrane helix small protein [Gammaproteobacteria bacterium]
MLIKTLIVVALIAIVVSLASGMLFLIRDNGKTERTAKALTVRIGLSVVLFGLLMLGVFTGQIKPHGIYPASHPANPPAAQPAK